ncbi:hypothetical protein LTR56_021710 [Elasticomyces elasticus]|nr:hypothetical protein LTR56_021710 [Elasticomyces elasticus]KAK3630612.1 hypothetical protein LTR22_021414 [Elasticomyces elasticus]KAK4909142.1 hypothetical protein LTR49_022041 [Elasticomyces elasticus]KAK5749222.1 hypothetical protein LTS12_020733 [Elasticomyces elasticus]
MAAIKVLSIPELLEEILLDLSTKEILFAQKVCKTWKQIIDTTPSLQRALFFVPARDIELSYPTGLQASFPRSVAAGQVVILPGYEEFHCLILNPLLVCGTASYLATQGHNFELLSKPLNAGTESSCNRMYLSQPPSIVTRSEYNLKNRTCYLLGTRDRSGSKTFGDLIAMRRFRAREESMAAQVKPRGQFKLRWRR